MSKPKAIDAYTNHELYAMLTDGRLHQAIGSGKKYHAVIDRLLQAGYPVESYRWRIVDGRSK